MRNKFGALLACLAAICVAVPAFGQASLNFRSQNTTIKNQLTIRGGSSPQATPLLIFQPYAAGSAIVPTTTFSVPQPAASRTISVPDAGGNSNLVLTTGNANGQVAKAEALTFTLCGNGTNGVLPVSSTIQFVCAVGRAGTVTQLVAGCITKPTATSSVTVQFFKNNLSTAMSAVYDLNSGTSGATAVVPITGNSTLATTDIVICQVVTGASINSCNGATATAEVLKSDY